ncbi:MAG: FxLYD domain-containing protein [Bacteroidota bacterium]
MRRRALAAMLLLILLAGCGGEQVALDAQVEDFRLVREEDGKQVVTGVLVNPTERTLASATVYVDLYDQPVEPGVEPVEAMQVEVRGVAPGDSLRFRQTVDTRLTLSGARAARIVVR